MTLNNLYCQRANALVPPLATHLREHYQIPNWGTNYGKYLDCFRWLELWLLDDGTVRSMSPNAEPNLPHPLQNTRCLVVVDLLTLDLAIHHAINPPNLTGVISRHDPFGGTAGLCRLRHVIYTGIPHTRVDFWR
jgi:hypothetical protein